MCNEHFVFQGEKREQHTQINVSAIQMIFRYTPRKARLCRAARPDHTKGTSGMVYDMFSYRNLYNVSHFKFITDTRLPGTAHRVSFLKSLVANPKPGNKAFYTTIRWTM